MEIFKKEKIWRGGEKNRRERKGKKVWKEKRQRDIKELMREKIKLSKKDNEGRDQESN